MREKYGDRFYDVRSASEFIPHDVAYQDNHYAAPSLKERNICQMVVVSVLATL